MYVYIYIYIHIYICIHICIMIVIIIIITSHKLHIGLTVLSHLARQLITKLNYLFTKLYVLIFCSIILPLILRSSSSGLSGSTATRS